ncbi:substrate-binding domain-containing protein [Alcaligenes sp. SDU_A2]|uniref:substrate-binding domain-containing protein n=1 Tax=Alcaligenes sp. SDU_A2 TaxID=3136634 RepID=UPI002C126A23|nr:substrate-binding domain-containing protein [Alcaligenes sp.]HRL27927.1 substrate-binding domain-containing protein [Alcaligenes sp.]
MANLKFKARLRSEWVLENAGGAELPMRDVLRLLGAIESLGHLSGASKACQFSYRHAWGLLRNAEKEFDAALLETSRRKGTKLTEFAQRLLWANRRLEARLTPTLESMASELQEELGRLYSHQTAHLRFQASHGFAIEGLMRLANDMDMLPLELRYRTAIEALASLERGDCDLAGFQVPLGQFESAALRRYGEWLSPVRHRLIFLSSRNTGLFVEKGNPKNISGIADLVRPDVRFVNRQIGSSTRFLATLLLGQLGVNTSAVPGFETTELTHMAVAAHVASGMADTGLGVETAACRCGLDFIPLAQERYFIAVQQETLDSAPMQKLMALITGPAYGQFMQELVGYDPQGMGRILTLEQAFGQPADLFWR